MKAKTYGLSVALLLLIAAVTATDACDKPCENNVLPGILQKIGMGFNILEANELQPVIEYCCSEGKTIIFKNKDKYAVPDGIKAVENEPKIECQTVQRYATTMYDYAKSVAQTYKTVPSSWGAFVGIEAEWYQQAQQKFSADDNWLSQTQCEIVVYNAHIEMTSTPNIAGVVLDRMRALPTEYDEKAYLAFLNAVGTHYLHDIDNGGSISQETYTALDYVEANGDKNTLQNAKGEYYITANENVYGPRYKVEPTYIDLSVPSTLTTIGGDFVVQGYVNFTEWSASVPRNPIPINFGLTPVSELFTLPWQKKEQQIVPDAKKKQQNVLRALRVKLASKGYCNDAVAINYNATMCADRKSDYAVCSDQLCQYINLITIDGQRVSGNPPLDVQLQDYTFVQGNAGSIKFRATDSNDSRIVNAFGGFYLAQLASSTSRAESSVGASTCISGNPLVSNLCGCPDYAPTPVVINIYSPTSTTKENGLQNVLYLCENSPQKIVRGGYTKKSASTATTGGVESDGGAKTSADCQRENIFAGDCACEKGYIEYLILKSDLGYLEYICVKNFAEGNEEQDDDEIEVLDS